MFSQIYNILLNFDSNPLICDPTLFPGKNSPNIAKNSRSFPGKMRWDRALVLTYFHSPAAEAFPRYYLSFLDFGHLQGEWVVKVGPKVQTLVPSLFHENSNPSVFFQTMFLFFIRQYRTIFWGVSAQKPRKKGHFMDAESVRKTLKTFNSTTTNAILMKLTTIVHLHKSVNQKPLRVKNSVFWCNVYEFLDYIKNHYICHALPCVASLVKFLYKFHEKPAKIGPKWLLR